MKKYLLFSLLTSLCMYSFTQDSISLTLKNTINSGNWGAFRIAFKSEYKFDDTIFNSWRIYPSFGYVINKLENSYLNYNPYKKLEAEYATLDSAGKKIIENISDEDLGTLLYLIHDAELKLKKQTSWRFSPISLMGALYCAWWVYILNEYLNNRPGPKCLEPIGEAFEALYFGFTCNNKSISAQLDKQLEYKKFVRYLLSIGCIISAWGITANLYSVFLPIFQDPHFFAFGEVLEDAPFAGIQKIKKDVQQVLKNRKDLVYYLQNRSII